MVAAQRPAHDRAAARRAGGRVFPFRVRARQFHRRHLPRDRSPEQLVFTWSAGAAPGQETVVTLDFLEQGAVTEVVLTHEHLATPERHALAAGGWSSCFDALASLLSSAHLDWWRLSNTGSRGADHRQSSS
jgi:uncharacterized protein YndB with AHSA1/START domain